MADKVNESNVERNENHTAEHIKLNATEPNEVIDKDIDNNDIRVQNKENDKKDDEFKEVKRKKNNSRRSITVIGDSMIKNIDGFKMKQGMESKDRIYVKTFPGAKIECMEDYVKPSLKYNPNVFLLHVGTNDLRSEKSPVDIGNDILTLAKKIKTPNNEVIISEIITRNDALDNKGKQVNKYVKLNCEKNSFLFCDNSNISKKYLNGSGLHLSNKGTITLANNFLKCLKY